MKGKAIIKISMDWSTEEPILTDEVEFAIKEAINIPPTLFWGYKEDLQSITTDNLKIDINVK